MRLTILYDNRAAREGMETGWGFSCLIESRGRTILFDTGADGDRLLSNMTRMGKAASHVDCIVLSHCHYDHTGGAEAVLRLNGDIRVVAPASFPSVITSRLAPLCREYREVEGPEEIAPGVVSTGEMGRIVREQALVADNGEGRVVITGCAHPGIVRVVERARELGNGKPILVVGGVHFQFRMPFQVKRAIGRLREIGVEKVAPCHCTGERGRHDFADVYGAGFLPTGAGSVIEV